MGPGSRTSEPVPKDITGKGTGAVARRRWASIERFWFDAHTVQNLSLYESGEVLGMVLVPSADGSSGPAVPSEEVLPDSGGGGGGGGGVIVSDWASRGSCAMIPVRWERKQTMKKFACFDTGYAPRTVLSSGRLEKVVTGFFQ